MNVEILLAFSLAVSILAITPGPDILYVLTLSLRQGAWSGLATVAGLMSGCLVHTALVAFVFSGSLGENVEWLKGIRWIGAAYMIYLSYKVYKSDANLSLQQEHVSVKGGRALYFQGILMNVLNPKVALFFLAFFPGFLFHSDWPVSAQLLFLGALFILISFAVFALVAFLAGSLANGLKELPGIGRFFKWLQLGAFLGIAVYLLLG